MKWTGCVLLFLSLEQRDKQKAFPLAKITLKLCKGWKFQNKKICPVQTYTSFLTKASDYHRKFEMEGRNFIIAFCKRRTWCRFASVETHFTSVLSAFKQKTLLNAKTWDIFKFFITFSFLLFFLIKVRQQQNKVAALKTEATFTFICVLLLQPHFYVTQKICFNKYLYLFENL